jgi:predicted dehydrogenase
MKKLKTVMVGVGRIGWQCHLPSMVKHEGFSLVAAANPLVERRMETENEFHIHTYEDAKCMFEVLITSVRAAGKSTDDEQRVYLFGIAGVV